jgi:hypothetical protein
MWALLLGGVLFLMVVPGITLASRLAAKGGPPQTPVAIPSCFPDCTGGTDTRTPTNTRTPTPTLTSTPSNTSTYTPTNTPTPTITPTSTCGPAWRGVASPNQSGDNYLNALAAVPGGAQDVWSVGYYYTSGSGTHQTLAEHWNGSGWSIVSSPNQTSHSYLFSAAAVSSNDVWAVGAYTGTNGLYQTLIEHWNGGQWSIVPSPDPGSGDNFLSSVNAASANDVWAAGYYNNTGGLPQTLVLHWNGSAWSQVAGANIPASSNYLYSVKALAANDVWATGAYTGTSGLQTLAEHWNGSAWSIVASPNPGSGDNVLYGAAAASMSDVWAVGYLTNTLNLRQTLIEHWNGSAWSVAANSSPGSQDNALQSVAAISANDVWAVGSYQNNGAPNKALIEHWNGTAWSLAGAYNSGAYDNILLGVAAVSPTDLWAAGLYLNSSAGFTVQTLAERYNDPCAPPTATFTSTPTVTGTPPTATSTPTVTPTGTNTNTQTATSTPDVSVQAVLLLAGGTGGAMGGYLRPGGSWVTSPIANGGTNNGLALSSVAAGNSRQGVGLIRSLPQSGALLYTAWNGLDGSWTAFGPVGQSVTTNSAPAIDSQSGVAQAAYQDPGSGYRYAAYSNGFWSPVGEPVGNPQASGPAAPAIAARGSNATVAFSGPTSPFPVYNLDRTGGSWGPPIPEGSGANPSIPPAIAAMTLGPELMLVYVQSTGQIMYSTRSGGNWSAPIGIQGALSADRVGLAALPNGQAVLGYRGSDGHLYTSFYASGTWSPPVVFGSPAPTIAGSPALAPGIAGDTAELAYIDASGGLVYYSRYTGGSWAAPVQVGGLANFGFVAITTVTNAPAGTATSTATNTPFGTPVSTSTPTTSNTPTVTLTATPTITPTTEVLVGHVTWQGPPPQPSARQQLPISITLKLGPTLRDYPMQNTDSSGSFTVTVSGLFPGVYNWRVKGPRYLANCGTVFLTGGAQTSQEMGLMNTGDANNDNLVSSQDFVILKNAFGTSNDLRADFNNDGVVTSLDFTLMKSNFGQAGCTALGP